MWICMPTMMRPQSCKSSTKYTTTCLHSAEVETPPTSRQNYSYPGFLRRNLRELQTSGREQVILARLVHGSQQPSPLSGGVGLELVDLTHDQGRFVARVVNADGVVLF